MDKVSGTPYPMLLRPLQEDEGGGWLAEIPNLPGCVSDGDTPEEAVRNVLKAQEAWLAVARDLGREIPKPALLPEDCSGKLTLRLPRSLHRRLSLRARIQGVELNELLLHLISCGLGVKVAQLPSGAAGTE